MSGGIRTRWSLGVFPTQAFSDFVIIWLKFLWSIELFFHNNRSEKWLSLKVYDWIGVFDLCTKVRLACEHLVQLVQFYFPSSFYMTQCIANEGKQLFFQYFPSGLIRHWCTSTLRQSLLLGLYNPWLFLVLQPTWAHLYCVSRSSSSSAGECPGAHTHKHKHTNTHSCSYLIRPQQPTRPAQAKISTSLAPLLVQQNYIFMRRHILMDNSIG